MSKTLLVLLVAVGVGIAVHRNQAAPPAVGADAAAITEAAAAKPSIFGKIGVRFVEGPVHRMSGTTQQMLLQMKPALKKASGISGRRAVEAANTAAALDRASLEALENAQPIKAVRAAIDARNYAKVSKGLLYGP